MCVTTRVRVCNYSLCVEGEGGGGGGVVDAIIVYVTLGGGGRYIHAFADLTNFSLCCMLFS